MRLPRDLSGEDLVKKLLKLGYKVERQRGSHIRLAHGDASLTHKTTIPNHASLKIGTLSGILDDVATHLKKDKQELMQELFG